MQFWEWHHICLITLVGCAHFLRWGFKHMMCCACQGAVNNHHLQSSMEISSAFGWLLQESWWRESHRSTAHVQGCTKVPLGEWMNNILFSTWLHHLYDLGMPTWWLSTRSETASLPALPQKLRWLAQLDEILLQLAFSRFANNPISLFKQAP